MNRRDPAISKGIDWSLIWVYLILVVVGLVAIFGATYKEGDPVLQSFINFKTDYSKQMYFFAVALILGLFILLTDSKFFSATANIWYAVGIFMLLIVFPFHSNIKGTESIIKLGAFNFQPAEFCKICVALALAKYLSRPDTDFSRTKSQLIATCLVLFPAVLTVMQKETGLALVFCAFFLVMYREGLPSGVLIVGSAIAILVVATLLIDKVTLSIILTAIFLFIAYVMRRHIRRNYINLLKIGFVWALSVGVILYAVPYTFKHGFRLYQVERIYSTLGRPVPQEYLDAHKDEIASQAGRKKDTDYNVRQSKIAVGSGGLIGKGLLKGTQTRYGFVPEQRTDFIFDTIAEGFGFIGCFVLLCIYLLLLFRIVAVAERQRSVFSRCYGYGVASVIFFHIVINIAMAIGLAPVIGIPLPFISYGGTSLLTFTIMIFILARLDADRHMVLR